MDYNLEIRLFIENNKDLLTFKIKLMKLIDYLLKENAKNIDNMNDINNIENENNTENTDKKKDIIIEKNITQNKLEKIKEFQEFINSIDKFEYLDKEFEKMPEEQEVYENEPFEFKNSILDFKIYLIKRANDLFMLSINFSIKDKQTSNFLVTSLINKIKDNKDNLFKEKFNDYFQEDLKIYLRLGKEELFEKENFSLKYGDNVIWIKLKPFIFKKDFLKVRKEVFEDLL